MLATVTVLVADFSFSVAFLVCSGPNFRRSFVYDHVKLMFGDSEDWEGKTRIGWVGLKPSTVPMMIGIVGFALGVIHRV